MRRQRDGEFERFDFTPAYDVGVDPEFPGSGNWAKEVYAFNRDGHRVQEFLSNWGAPRVFEVRPHDSDPWIGMLPHGGLGGLSGAFAMPNPSQTCLTAGGLALVMDVDHPEREPTLASVWAQQATASADPSLLLVSTWLDVTAFDAAGVAWQSPRLVLDGLHVLAAEKGAVVVAGRRGYEDTVEQFELDAYTGLPIRPGAETSGFFA